MDEESKQLLTEIRNLQLEQLELTRKIYSGVPPWMTWRFSLRRLLVALTIMAMLFGVVAALARWGS